MNKQTNDNAAMLIALQDKGVKLVIVTGRSLGLKGKGQAPCYEEMDGIPVHRLFKNSLDILLFPRRKLKKSLQIAKSLKPDLIFCSMELNMPLALLLQRYLKVPIVLLVEDAGRILSGEASKSMGKPGSYGLLLHGIPRGPAFWSWLCKNSSALITCHPRDLAILDKLSHYGKPVFYLPWPTYIPPDLGPLSSREHYRGVYVGSLYPFKNTQEFEWTLPRILKETCTKEFVVIGPGPHAKIVEDLQRETHGAVKHIQHLPRKKALHFIASSYYAYTPVIKGGWGFIGDCWSMKTPIVMTHNDNYVANNVNALVAKNENDLIRSINRLYEEPELYKKLQRNGYRESEKRKAEFVSGELYNIFKKTIENVYANSH
jgi:glycosyltransferase involved in cell wall biosynthesis